MKQVHLFVGSRCTLYHCHFDLQPNLHVQLIGRKRFILFPPEAWRSLYPFPVHHEYDRRARVNLDAPDEAAHPGCTDVRGVVVELEPGELLYIPPGWWHHVQTCSTPCVSMAWWFYERLREASAAELQMSAVDREQFGVGERARELLLTRWLEESCGRLLAPLAEAGDIFERARQSGASWGGWQKERAVAKLMARFALGAARRRATRGEGSSAREAALREGLARLADEELPALLEGIEFHLLEESVRERISSELGEAKVDAFILDAVQCRGFI